MYSGIWGLGIKTLELRICALKPKPYRAQGSRCRVGRGFGSRGVEFLFMALEGYSRYRIYPKPQSL